MPCLHGAAAGMPPCAPSVSMIVLQHQRGHMVYAVSRPTTRRRDRLVDDAGRLARRPSSSATLGGGLLTLGVDAGAAEVDDLTIAEPGSGRRRPGRATCVLGVGRRVGRGRRRCSRARPRPAAGGVVLRRATARSRAGPRPRPAPRVGLVELADHASWAHVVWLLRGVLDRAAGGPARARRGPGARRALRPRRRLRRPRRRPHHHRGHPVAGARLLLDARTSPTRPGCRPSSAAACPTRSSPSLRGRGRVPAAGPLRRAVLRPGRAGPRRPPRRAGAGRHRVAGLDLGRRRRGARPSRSWRSLAQTASVVALHLLRLRSQADLARRVSADRLRAVLSGDTARGRGLAAGPPVARRRARRRAPRPAAARRRGLAP